MSTGSQTNDYLSEPLSRHDPEVFSAIEREENRQSSTLELIASENHTSRAVREAAGSVLTNKYAEGYPGRRYYGGCAYVDQIEQLAIDRAKELFGAEHANVQPHSGSQANMAVYMAALKPGQTMLAMDLAHGGHLTHGMKINFSGLYYNIVSYGVQRESGRIDYDQVRSLAMEHRPQLLVAGASAYPRMIDFETLAAIAGEVDCVLMVDMAHIAGLIAGGAHPSPVPHADFVTTTTHKTLRGPRSGLVLCKAHHAKLINSRVFPGLQGGPFMHIIAAKAVALGEALTDGFKQYAQSVVANAKTLASALVERGFCLVSGGTDTHLILVDFTDRDFTGKQAEDWLQAASIICNKNLIPFDTRRPMETSGIRLGTPAITTRGLGPEQVCQVGNWIADVLESGGSDAVVQKTGKSVSEMCAAFPLSD